MKLIITEKPSVARKISYFIFGKSVKQKRLKNLTIYLSGDYIIVPAIGHIFNLNIKGSGIPVFEYEWQPRAEHYCMELYNYLRSISDKITEVMIATDYDIEGELIGYNIVRFCLGNVRIKRMKFSEITKNAITNAFKNPVNINYNLVRAGETRHILDLLYGINFSRYLQKTFKKLYLSAGRVQTPLLKIIYQREVEIEKFIPKEFYKILLETEKFKVYYSKIFDDRASALKTKSKASDTCLVNDIKIEIEKIKPNPPFNLTKLQSESWRLYKIKPNDTLKIAQKLYESGYISYPRTSSEKYPKNINFKQILLKFNIFNEYKKYLSYIFKNWPITPIEGKKTDPAHPCIYPTGYIPKKMSKKEFYVYRLIVKRFISTFLPPALVNVYLCKIISGSLEFELKFKKFKEKSWVELYPTTIEIKDINIEKGEKLPCKIKIKKEKTKPPARYNPATLVKYMESINIGTKSTRAMMIEKLYKRGYISGTRAIKITDLGKKVIEFLEKEFPKITSIELTREMEKELESIENGKTSDIINRAKLLIKNSIQNK